MMRTILITGATSGFGKGTAYRFAKENYRLILTGKRCGRDHSLYSQPSRQDQCK